MAKSYKQCLILTHNETYFLVNKISFFFLFLIHKNVNLVSKEVRRKKRRENWISVLTNLKGVSIGLPNEECMWWVWRQRLQLDYLSCLQTSYWVGLQSKVLPITRLQAQTNAWKLQHWILWSLIRCSSVLWR